MKKNRFYPSQQSLQVLMCVKKKINYKPNWWHHKKCKYLKVTMLFVDHNFTFQTKCALLLGGQTERRSSHLFEQLVKAVVVIASVAPEVLLILSSHCGHWDASSGEVEEVVNHGH